MVRLQDAKVGVSINTLTGFGDHPAVHSDLGGQDQGFCPLAAGCQSPFYQQLI
jgi:hypothetical protein